MQITGTHFNYFQLCQRKLWLFGHNIQMEHTSDLVYEGRLIHENSYPQRSSKYEEIEIGGIKIDYYDAKNRVIHEIKKSDKKEEAHEWQLKYYIYVLEKQGVNGVTGILEYPKLRKTQEVLLSALDKEEIINQLTAIETMLLQTDCPEKIPVSKCRNCSYFDFCYAGEEEQL
ncbi:MAG: CRISPR-associated protein Cas4 [Bacteroidetes bacterium HGW-Bacteroidetes-4]|jgi:CRISPR-associated exonuclease Cas4|nr:MAG: CRISPR-associated protein Cas4 [Bacteroidetes bacterium HGW-Bacteroidetes-4]